MEREVKPNYYKLLKDLPYAKAGEVFERVTHKSEDGLSDYDYLEIKKRVKDGEDEVNFGIKYNYFLNNFDDWFEEIPELTDSIHWEPLPGDIYWFVDCWGVVFYTKWDNTITDAYNFDSGNVYRTKEECIRARSRRLAEVRLQQTSTFKPDFKNGNGGWVVMYDYFERVLAIECYSFCNSGEPVRYETEEEALKSIKENREDWLTYFGIDPSDTDEN